MGDNPFATLVSKIDAGDPLYLHPSDASNLTIINVKLKGTENYRVWANAMKLALKVKNKYGFIDGTCIIDEDDDVLINQWERCNSVVLTWLLNSISEELYLGQVYSSLASDVWKDLKETYDKVDGSVVFDLYQKINSFSQNNMSVSEYYHKLTVMWKDLDQILQLPTCTCEAAKQFNDFSHLIKLMQFLMGLDSEYQSVISNLLIKDSLPTIKDAFAIISREESRKNSSNGGIKGQTQTVGFVSKSNQFTEIKKKNKTANSGLKCSHCNKTGHTVDKCFEIIGYPSWMKPRNGQGKRPGSFTAMCETTSSSDCASPLNFLSTDQVAKLMSLLGDKSSDGGSSSNVSSNISGRFFCSSVLGSKTYCFTSSSQNNSMTWIIDSGANHHMVMTDHCLINQVNISDLNIRVKHPNGTNALVTKIGDIKLSDQITLNDVFVIPEYCVNLLSVHRLSRDSKVIVYFDENKCYLQDLLTKKNLVIGRQVDGLYLSNESCVQYKVCNSVCNISDLWHARLGHPSHVVLKFLKNDLKINQIENVSPCETCHRAKQHRDPFPLSDHHSKSLGELIHLDVWGPFKVASREGFRYFLTVVDDYSRAVWIFLMKSKSEVFTHIQTFVALIKTQFDKLVKVFRSDNGTEFVNTQMNNFCKANGIIHQTTCVYTPQQNGIAERKHRHLLNVARALLFQGNFPLNFWSECVLTAAYLINRTPSSVLDGKTPYQCVYGFKAVLSHLRLVGCLCFSTVLNKENKFSSNAEKAVLLGYSNNKKGYKLWSLDNKVVYYSRDVKFYENIFPFKTVSNIEENNNQGVNSLNFFEMFDSTDPGTSKVAEPNDENTNNSENTGSHGSQQSVSGDESTQDEAVLYSPDEGAGQNITEQSSSLEPGQGRVEHEASSPDLDTNSEGNGSQPNISVPVRRSSRQTVVPSKFNDYIIEGKVKYGLEKVVNYANLSHDNFCFVAQLNKESEPKHYFQAAKSPNWISAMNDEIEALHRNNTWDLVELPPGRKTVGCKWIYKIKYKSTGEIDRYKARLVAKGYSQKEGIDFDETFSPVVKMITVRTVLTLAVENSWPLYQLDINNAFLYGDLHEDVYMALPEGYYSKTETRVCKLRKSLYGLKQAPRMWNEKLVGVLLELGFSQSKCDYSMFIKQNNSVFIVLLVYVDDIIITGNNINEFDKLKELLKTKFLIKDLGELKYFLGIEVIKMNNGICLSQRKYCIELLAEFGMTGSKPINVPIEKNYILSSLNKDKNEPVTNISGYQRLVGKLIYLSHTRPDIAYAVHYLSQFMHSPKQSHMAVAYADSDWAKCLVTRKSVTGYCVFLGSSLVTWKSKKQSTVARSTAEAEYRSMCTATTDVMWLINLLQELGVHVDLPVSLYCDNTAAMSIASNPVFHDRTKHFELDLFFLRDQISKGCVKTVSVGTSDQIADLFTKGLMVSQHEKLCDIVKDGTHGYRLPKDIQPLCYFHLYKLFTFVLRHTSAYMAARFWVGVLYVYRVKDGTHGYRLPKDIQPLCYFHLYKLFTFVLRHTSAYMAARFWVGVLYVYRELPSAEKEGLLKLPRSADLGYLSCDCCRVHALSLWCWQVPQQTFPGHPWLDTPEGHASLWRVLVGYYYRDCDVGYRRVVACNSSVIFTFLFFSVNACVSRVSNACVSRVFRPSEHLDFRCLYSQQSLNRFVSRANFVILIVKDGTHGYRLPKDIQPLCYFHLYKLFTFVLRHTSAYMAARFWVGVLYVYRVKDGTHGYRLPKDIQPLCYFHLYKLFTFVLRHTSAYMAARFWVGVLYVYRVKDGTHGYRLPKDIQPLCYFHLYKLFTFVLRHTSAYMAARFWVGVLYVYRVKDGTHGYRLPKDIQPLCYFHLYKLFTFVLRHTSAYMAARFWVGVLYVY
ncbi:hypothetical protein SSX86_031804, partial [Deinandra increscens subsp. villosa]